MMRRGSVVFRPRGDTQIHLKSMKNQRFFIVFSVVYLDSLFYSFLGAQTVDFDDPVMVFVCFFRASK